MCGERFDRKEKCRVYVTTIYKNYWRLNTITHELIISNSRGRVHVERIRIASQGRERAGRAQYCLRIICEQELSRRYEQNLLLIF